MKHLKHFSPTDGDFFHPPKYVTVEGIDYPIRWDFETAFLFMEYVDASQDDDATFLETVLSLWYPVIPKNRDKAMDEAIRFYCGGTMPEEGYYSPSFSPVPRREEVYFDFLKHYKIDLNRERLHWWIFRRLAEELKERRTPSWTENKYNPSQVGRWLG